MKVVWIISYPNPKQEDTKALDKEQNKTHQKLVEKWKMKKKIVEIICSTVYQMSCMISSPTLSDSTGYLASLGAKV